MICAVPLGRLKPQTAFLIDLKESIMVGVVEKVRPGYTQVVVSDDSRKIRSFMSADGRQHEFVENGFQRTEWASGTLVRPLVSNTEGQDMSDNPLVDAGEAPKVADIKERAAKLAAKAAAKAAEKPVKPAKGDGVVSGKQIKKDVKAAAKAKTPKAPKEPKEQKPCRCACGTLTGGTFAPGHDARYFGWLKKIVAGKMEFKELPKALQKEFVDAKGVRKALAASNH